MAATKAIKTKAGHGVGKGKPIQRIPLSPVAQVADAVLRGEARRAAEPVRPMQAPAIGVGEWAAIERLCKSTAIEFPTHVGTVFTWVKWDPIKQDWVCLHYDPEAKGHGEVVTLGRGTFLQALAHFCKKEGVVLETGLPVAKEDK